MVSRHEAKVGTYAEDRIAALSNLAREMEAAGIDVEEVFDLACSKWSEYIEEKSGYHIEVRSRSRPWEARASTGRDPRYIYYGNLAGTPLAERPDFPQPIIPLPPKLQSVPRLAPRLAGITQKGSIDERRH
nr:hypothetical protein [Candidatus Sigynarchaeota archaeon]